jgi:hypothetical protein
MVMILFAFDCDCLRQHDPEAYEDLLEWADVPEEAVPEALKVLFADNSYDLGIIGLAEKSKI